jgi:hypothetical protein
MKTYNKLYESCNMFLGKPLDENDRDIRIIFGVCIPPENKEVRRNHINQLYFNIVNSLLGDDWLRDFYEIRGFVQANDKDGYISKKLDDICLNIQNGGLQK